MADDFYKDKKVIIFGGTSGIGYGIVRYLFSKKAKILAASHNTENLEKIKNEIGSDISIFKVNVQNEYEIKNFFSTIDEYDFLIFTSFQYVTGLLKDLTIPDMQNAFQTKFWGQVMAVKYGTEKIKQNGSIVLFSGVYGVKPQIGSITLAAINAAIDCFVKGMALEIAPVRINAISPGWVDTPMRKYKSPEEKKEYINSIEKSIPLKRICEIDDITQMVDSLLKNQYMTGNIIYLDGGAHLK